MTRNPKIGNTPIWVLPNIWTLGQGNNTAKCQGCSFYCFWVIEGKPTGGCMLHHCDSCPESDVKDFLKAHLSENYSVDESIKFMLWVSKEQSQLQDKKELFQDFIKILSSMMFVWSKYHNISKKQSNFFKDLRSSLKLKKVMCFSWELFICCSRCWLRISMEQQLINYLSLGNISYSSKSDNFYQYFNMYQ